MELLIIPQVCAIPFRFHQGKLEFLLITKPNCPKHWIFPKGFVEWGEDFLQGILREAFEEAGVTGQVFEEELYTYHRTKCGQRCQVRTFLLEVFHEELRYPEAHKRLRRWYSPQQARDLVRNFHLKEIIDRAQECLERHCLVTV